MTDIGALLNARAKVALPKNSGRSVLAAGLPVMPRSRHRWIE
jgi:hypothetical protein